MGILTKLCKEKKLKITEANACPDHIHILVIVLSCLSISRFVVFLKGKKYIDRHANLKYKYGSRHFWCGGYFVDTVVRNETVIKQYIQNRLNEDFEYDQIILKKYVDQFTDSKN